MMAGGGAHWWSRSQITPWSSGQSRYCGDRDAEPGRAVPGFIDHFVQDLVQLECVQQYGIFTGVAPGAAGVTRQEGGSCPAGPGCCRAAGVFLFPGTGDIVERAQHPGYVPKCQIRLRALGKRPHWFALEVDHDPSTAGYVKYLSQMVVAVDPLQRRPPGR